MRKSCSASLTEPKALQAVDAIRPRRGRGESLTRQLLTFSRRQQLMPVRVDLHARIGPFVDMLAARCAAISTLAVDIADKLWPVEVDRRRTRARARQHRGQRARCDAARRHVHRAGAQRRRTDRSAGEVAGRRFVRRHHRHRHRHSARRPPEGASSPFFTTKAGRQGHRPRAVAGHGFANQSGGAVTVASEPDRGTVVTVYLPRAQVKSPAMPSGHGHCGSAAFKGLYLSWKTAATSPT